MLLTGLGLMMVSSCDKISDLTLNPDETVAKEGNYWITQGSDIPNTTVTVSENKKGVATMSFSYNGEDYAIKAKVTKTKVQDFVYSNGDEDKPFTLVDFDAKVGDKWEYKVGTETVVREVVHKSTDDDYMVWALGMMIKVSQVEETIPEGIMVMGYPTGAKKILWTFNHKFGWIGAEITKRDDTMVYLGLNETNAGL